jgi:hypothetical protein
MELRTANHPKHSYSSLRRLGFETNCPSCKSGLQRIYRFKALRHLALVITLVTIALLFLGMMNIHLAFEILLPLALLGLAGRIYDGTYPNLSRPL